MASVKVKFRLSSIDGKEGSIYYQVIHNRVVRHIRTDYRIFESEWNGKLSMIEIPAILPAERKQHLRLVIRQVNRDVGRLESIIRDLSYSSCSTDAIINRFREISESQSFYNFMESVIAQLRRLNRERTSETYSAALSSFMRFRQNKDVQLDDMDTDLMMEYEAWLKMKGVSLNTLSFYMRILRATYNRAVECGVAAYVPRLFGHVIVKSCNCVKRSLDAGDMGMLLVGNGKVADPELKKAGQVFSLMFLLRGIPFVDLAYLRKGDICGGVLHYRRRKTGRLLMVKLSQEAQGIIGELSAGTPLRSPYLFPFISSPEGTEAAYNEYQRALRHFNRQLGRLSRAVLSPSPLSTYAARHTWATMAYYCEIHHGIISEALGHSSIAVTEAYLRPFRNDRIDRANDTVIEYVKHEARGKK